MYRAYCCDVQENVQRLVRNVPALSNMTDEQLGLDELNQITALKSAEIESVLDKMNVKQRKALVALDLVRLSICAVNIAELFVSLLPISGLLRLLNIRVVI